MAGSRDGSNYGAIGVAEMERGCDDATLVREVADRSAPALSEIYRRYGSTCVSLARQVARSETLAEDITQEVFVRLWQHPDRFDAGRGSLRTYLLTHVHGRAVDLMRNEASRRHREDRSPDVGAATVTSLDDALVERDEAAAVRRALAMLTPRERAAIELAYFGGHTYREVAELLDEPEGTVKSRIRTGLARLRNQLYALRAGEAQPIAV